MRSWTPALSTGTERGKQVSLRPSILLKGHLNFRAKLRIGNASRTHAEAHVARLNLGIFRTIAICTGAFQAKAPLARKAWVWWTLVVASVVGNQMQIRHCFFGGGLGAVGGKETF